MNKKNIEMMNYDNNRFLLENNILYDKKNNKKYDFSKEKIFYLKEINDDDIISISLLNSKVVYRHIIFNEYIAEIIARFISDSTISENLKHNDKKSNILFIKNKTSSDILYNPYIKRALREDIVEDIDGNYLCIKDIKGANVNDRLCYVVDDNLETTGFYSMSLDKFIPLLTDEEIDRKNKMFVGGSYKYRFNSTIKNKILPEIIQKKIYESKEKGLTYVKHV